MPSTFTPDLALEKHAPGDTAWAPGMHANLDKLDALLAILAGRAGGQRLVGGLAPGENLDLESTADPVKGLIRLLDDAVCLGDLTVSGVLNAVAERLRESGGPTVLTLGVIPNGQVLRRSGTQIVGDVLGGPPGTWVQLAKGPTTVANNTTVTLATLSGILDDEIVVPHIGVRSDVTLLLHSGDADSAPPNGQAVYAVGKTTTPDQHILKLRQRSGVSATFDWVVYKVRPA